MSYLDVLHAVIAVFVLHDHRDGVGRVGRRDLAPVAVLHHAGADTDDFHHR